MARTALIVKQRRGKERFLHAIQNGKKPVMATRVYNRCQFCARSRGYMGFFGICRICFRELATNGEVPGVTKHPGDFLFSQSGTAALFVSKMPSTDPIADLLTRMRNAQAVRRESCVCPWSRHKEELCNLLKNVGFLSAVAIAGEGKEKMITVVFDSAHQSLTLTRVSKPGRRVYQGKEELKPHLRGYGLSILSTSKGLMTDKQAKKEGVGGEVLCTVS